MADHSYVLFDSVATGTAASDNLLFQVAQGGDSTHTEDFTNNRGAGSLPSSEKFVLDKMCVLLPPSIDPSNLATIFVGAFLQFHLLNQVLFWSPLQALLGYSGWNAFFTLSVAATNQVAGFIGDGFVLANPITIGGGEKFDVRVKITGAPSATFKLVVGLFGTLSLP